MKTVLKYVILTSIVLLISLVVFFFWGSAPNLDTSSYSKVTKYVVPLKSNNDSIYSIITYNVGYLSGMTNNLPFEKSKSLFTDNMKALKSNLNTVNPDVIAFQEIDFDSDRSFNINQSIEVSKLGYMNDAQTINWDTHYVPFPYGRPSVHFGKVISGQSLVSKFPINYHKTYTLKRVESMPFLKDAFYLDRLAQVVSLEIEDQLVYVINVHLEAFDKPTRETHLNTVIDLYNTYATTYPTILLGDFNSNPTNRASVILKLLNKTDVGCAGFNLERIENTYNSRNPSKRIDFIFYNTNKIQEVSGRVLTAFGEISDHLPVEMRFKLKH